MNNTDLSARKVGRALLKASIAGALLSAASLAHSQAAPPVPADDGSISWKGITLYGIVDVALQYDTHGVPFSDYYPAGSAELVQKNSNHSAWGIIGNQMAQSRIGLSGVEPTGIEGLSAVFRVETYFNPWSGQLSDGPKSLAVNNGRSAANQTTNLDSSVAGEPFEQAYVGLSHKEFGTLTFGRQNTILADLISKYDPNAASQGFSVIGVSGTTAGAGDTQDRRFDNAVKYVANIAGMVHVQGMYKPNQSYGGANKAYEVGVGGEYAGFSVDAIFAKVYDAIAAATLSAAQVTTLPTLGLGFSADHALAATLSDNTSLTVAGLYNWAPMGLKLYGGMEYIQYNNPQYSLPVGYDDLGYKLAFINTAAFPHPKQFQVYWAGVKYALTPAVDLTGAYYGYHQNSYGSGANSGCTTNIAGTCSGNLHAFSIDVDWKLSKRFDAYAGVMYSTVENGLSNGYAFSRNNMNPTIGMRYKF